MHNEKGIQRGKDFEEIIKKSFLEVDNTTIERLPDPTQGYLGVRNKSDFIVYHYPYQYYIECKTVHSNRLPFNNITFNQRTGMLEVSKIKGIVAGIICWYIPLDKTVFIPIQVVEKYRLAGYKSINMNNTDMLADRDIIDISGVKKRIFFDYDLGKFIDYCNKHKLGEKEYKI